MEWLRLVGTEMRAQGVPPGRVGSPPALLAWHSGLAVRRGAVPGANAK